MRLALPNQSIEIAIEDDQRDEQAYVQITTEGTVTVRGAAGEQEVVELTEDLQLHDPDERQLTPKAEELLEKAENGETITPQDMCDMIDEGVFRYD